jgi:hypothetical protein
MSFDTDRISEVYKNQVEDIITMSYQFYSLNLIYSV